ncbi:benzothiadiazole-induced S-adenosyl-L-methionine salicylic acid carboxyl methyltransferase 1 [Seminavis robusta]|uniref:Benzothiadiazole-induced S-adenosyl-L-methionine salicylic acid carboxyl methyltransferase 1 n=1 Tax=Seminavis robusta TaxID=568900 RepID=A0A9N8EAI4_9STRA|nr:benzothiadiazole-induced S-adenosyl-L-methionine salicylic acid carboxyl methyltransferase 1 [Seminavis robusta]|eukprot:Sro677_g185830.1 benzothiadiazole-induced S-adenosyl-L-methionine salicylic acid carboxyl methyltransferase 1 (466) ;mRNA; f:22882-24279
MFLSKLVLSPQQHRRTLVTLLSLQNQLSCASCRSWCPKPSQNMRFMTTKDNSASANSMSSSSTMKTESYHDHSIHQYSAHRQCQHLLEAVLQRMSQRLQFQDADDDQRRHIVDLGSADGSNSMLTLKWAVWTLQQHIPQGTLPPLQVTFEEHPVSNEQFLRATLASHDDWFHRNNIRYSVLMKSFYEPLFDPDSVDLFMSYICLHWLDTTDPPLEGTSDTPGWKLLQQGPEQQNPSPDFTFMNEATTPSHLQDHYRELAQRHLAKFLAFRARELKPGGEMVLLMVSQPNDFVTPRTPKDDDNQQYSVLTLAMHRCIQRGLIRPQVLERTLLPYYLRTKQDVRDALALAASIQITSDDAAARDRPGALLALVGDVETYNVRLGTDGGEQSNEIQGASDMFWSIHAKAVQSAGATETELEAVRRETESVFHELFSSGDGVNVTYLACVIRRRTREAWSSGKSEKANQ